MSKAVIIVEGLGKQYNIGTLHKKQQHDTLRDKIASGFKSAKKHIAHRTNTMLGAEKFWALRDVSFEVKRGEVLGIIGKNGAGKSTLLKILCKVTSPTEGKAILKGRIGTLLEVGTGFHPELTGRENIYLSGAILGMDKAYIERKIDEIIAFSGIEKFIDTPVKRYSSGMRVRLGFAVAAHLEPEILLIDEVLAVGDITFQKRCLGKMNEITDAGRTILFVSHNMSSIRTLCTKCILLSNGEMKKIGSQNYIVDEYINMEKSNHEIVNPEDILGDSGTKINNVFLSITDQDKLVLKFNVECQETIPSLGIDLVITAQDGAVVSKLGSGVTGFVIPKAQGKYVCRVDSHEISKYLSGGTYYIGINLSIPKIGYLLKTKNVVSFSLEKEDIYSTANPVSYRRCGTVPLRIQHSYLS